MIRHGDTPLASQRVCRGGVRSRAEAASGEPELAPPELLYYIAIVPELK